jgi:hypothetical protein
MMVPDRLQRVEPGQVRHHPVEQDQVRALPVDLGERLHPVLAQHGLVTGAAELPVEHHAIVLDIVDDEDAAGGGQIPFGRSVHAAMAILRDWAI